MLRRVAGASVAAWVLISMVASGTALGGRGPSVAAAGVSPQKWWGTVCADLNAYTKDTAKFQKTLVATLNNPKSLGDVKAHLVGFLHSNVARADTLIADLKKAGTPNAPNGAQYATAIRAGFVQLRDGLEGLLPDANAAPTESKAGMQAVISTLQAKVTAVGNQGAAAEDAARQAAAPQLTAARLKTKACNAANQ